MHCLRNNIFFLFLTLWSSISLAQAPSANFKSDITGGCSPIVVNFSDQSSGSPVSWQWDLGNGSTSTKQNPSATYFNPGTYTITLTVTNASGATNTISKTSYITVYDPPSADFDATNRTGCTPTVVQFTDRSVTPPGTTINGWQWDFGDGGTSNQKNPKYVYRTPGSYTVTLTIYNDKGCSKVVTKPNYMNPTDGVNASFNFVDPGVCSAPATIQFNNTSSGPGTLSYNWDLGNGVKTGAVNTSTTYTKNGNYRISLIVNSNQGCTDSMVTNIQVGKVQSDFNLPTSLCPKVPLQFTNNSTPRPIKSAWSFSNGTTDNHINGSTVFSTGGTYTVTMVNTYNVCTDTLTKTISIKPPPSVSFAASDTGKCQAPFTVNFSNSSDGTSYIWDFGDSITSTQATPAHTYTKDGIYTVKLIAVSADGCTDTLIKKDYIQIKKPIITFPTLPTQGCIPYNFTFKADIVSSDPVVNYNWDFGDGNSGTGATPSHVYKDSGTYNVSLTITTKGGCSEKYTLNEAVKVGPIPTADFTVASNTGCADPGIQFTNLSKNATEYLWTFSDGSTDTQKNPLHRFEDTGWVSVTLAAINNGCENKITRKNYVYILPSISKFDYVPDCNNRLIYTFINKSIQANTWLWNFGDGTTFNGPNPGPHTFPGLGTWKVSLTTSNGACTYKLERTIEIADFTPDFVAQSTEGCKPSYFLFKPDLKNPKMFKKITWDFGDGTGVKDLGNMESGEYIYFKPGTYDITLNAIDSFGCTYSITKKAYVHVYGPVAKFGAIQSSGCKGLNVTFLDSTITDGTNSIVKWKWDFGDGTIQNYTGSPFQHRYDSIGNYDVKLVATDAKGCSDSITRREFINISVLKAGFTADMKSCPGTPVNFKDTTKSDLPFTSLWDFGDNTKGSTLNPSHPYSDTGYFTIKLVVTDILGCVDSTVVLNNVYINKPKASFTANNLTSFCPPFKAVFKNTSFFAESSFWDLTLGTSNQTDPSIYYTNSGTYPIKLVVTSPGGCKDSTTNKVVVRDMTSATMNYDPLIGCRPLQVNFDAFTQMNGNFIWDFGDGVVIDTSVNQITHIYDNMGPFKPKIILKEPGGCIIPLVGKNTIEIYGVRASFKALNHLFCDSGYVKIIDSTIARDPIVSYNWDMGDGTKYNVPVPDHQYTNPGLYNITFVATTQNGCTDTARLPQPIKVVASPLIDIKGDSVICANDKINYLGIFQRPDTSATQWQWKFPNGNSSNLQDPATQQFTQPGNYFVSLTAINSSGCIDSVTKPLLVHALPKITAQSPITKLVGVPLLISPTYSSGVVSYLWNPAKDLDCSTCPTPTTTTKFSTSYQINVTDSNGCQKDTLIQVHVLCQGSTVFVPNTFSPNGDGSNDVFYVRGKGLDRVKSLRIFNRWGQVVFEQKDLVVNDPAYGWDGRYKGNRPQSDVYVYQIEVYCENGEILRFDGNVTLIQ